VQQGYSLSTSKEIKGKEKEVLSGGGEAAQQQRGRGRPPKSQTNQTASPARELGGDKRAAESMAGNEEDGGGGTPGGKRHKTTEHTSVPLHQTPTRSAGSSLPTTITTITSPTTLHSTSTGGTHLVVSENTLYIPTKEEKARLLQDLGAARKSTISSE